MLITCPEDVIPGMTIQVAGPSSTAATVTGVPVTSVSMVSPGVGMGVGMGMGVPTPQVVMTPEVGYVEVDEISSAGWVCLIVGCFACPGLNWLGLCMRERRLIPVSPVII